MKKALVSILILLIFAMSGCGNTPSSSSSEKEKTTESVSDSADKQSSLSEILSDPEEVKKVLPDADTGKDNKLQYELLSVPYETKDEILVSFQAKDPDSGTVGNHYCMVLIRSENGKLSVIDQVFCSDNELSDVNSEAYKHLDTLVGEKYKEVNQNDTLTKDQIEAGTQVALDTFFKESAVFSAWSEEEKAQLKEHLSVKTLPYSAIPFDPAVWVRDTSIKFTDLQYLIGIKPDYENLPENISDKCANIWGKDFTYVPMSIVLRDREYHAGIAIDLYGILDGQFESAE